MKRSSSRVLIPGPVETPWILISESNYIRCDQLYPHCLHSQPWMNKPYQLGGTPQVVMI